MMEAGNKTLKTLFVLSAAAIFFSGAAVLDLRARAKSAWLTAERYSEWQRRPEIKKLYFHDIYAKKTIALKKSGMAPEKLEKELSGLETEKDFLIHESSAKYAYIWYKTASSAFCRPENKWCALAREKLGAAKNSWKTELRSKNIKFEDWMVD